MDSRRKMKLRPLLWRWNDPPPAAGWLDALPKNLPAVYMAELPEDSSTLSELASLLSTEERARLERFRVRDDQRRFLAGRGLLRILLGAHLRGPAGELEFKYSSAGKPYLAPRAGVPMVHFNVSHSGNLVVLAFHPAGEVGVDLEEMRPHSDLEGVAERIFSAEEFRQWKALEEPGRHAAFFRLWTRHEASMKALGLGLAGENAYGAKQVELWDLELPFGYAGAVGWLLGK
jgi:4'-phosphopantetheinyl transferase